MTLVHTIRVEKQANTITIAKVILKVEKMQELKLEKITVKRKEGTMPVKRCKANGKQGYKWGNSGKCYTCKNAKAKAERQGRAAYANGYKGKK